MKVSIIVPVYNAEDTIEKCVKSILNQTYKDIELLIINDGSKDKSLKILNNLSKKDNRIVVIDKQNEGVSKTRNLGIEKSSGDYIMFIDNDDYIEKDYIESFIKIAEDNDIVVGGYKRIDENNKEMYHQTLKNTEWSKYIVLAPWAKLYRRDFLINNNIQFLDYEIGEDVYFNLIAYSKTNKIKIIDNTKYIWFYNSKSVSNTKQKSINKNIDILVLINNLLKEVKAKDKYFNYFIERYIVWYLLFSGRNSKRNEFINEFKRLYKWKKDKRVKSRIFPLSFKLKGESFKNRIAVLLFRVIKTLHLTRVFARIYCKGGN